MPANRVRAWAWMMDCGVLLRSPFSGVPAFRRTKAEIASYAASIPGKPVRIVVEIKIIERKTS